MKPISGKSNAARKMQRLSALGVSLSQLFEKVGETDGNNKNIPLECYELLLSKSKEEQELLYRILLAAEQYKNH